VTLLDAIDALIPRQVFELALVLFLSFLLGLEREEHKVEGSHYVFGGIRTFPLVGLVGWGLALVSGGNAVALAIGFAVVGGLMGVSYWHKVRADASAGATTEVSGLLTYLIGALVHAQAYWAAVAIGVLGVLLLELREGLARLTARVGREEVLAFTKFLVLAVVVLPALPNRPLTRFAINPFRIWLVVVAVSGLSYASYLLQKWLKQRGGVIVTAILGGAYSSTATTVVLARSSNGGGSPRVLAGSILAASGMMYLRILVLVLLFDPRLANLLAPGFCGLATLAVGVGVWLTVVRDGARTEAASHPTARNPLELRTAFVFAALFVVVLVLTHLAAEYVGPGGLYALAALFGVSDVDPFVLGLAQAGGYPASLHVVAGAITVATATNNLAKGVYARVFGERSTGNLSLALLGGLALAGLVPLVWL
jgi:uncharacterized membrane protein (DUF4010 family)